VAGTDFVPVLVEEAGRVFANHPAGLSTPAGGVDPTCKVQLSFISPLRTSRREGAIPYVISYDKPVPSARLQDPFGGRTH
jgi:hypothetical protein